LVDRTSEEPKKKVHSYSFFRGRRERRERVDAAGGPEYQAPELHPPDGDALCELNRLYAHLMARRGAPPLISPLELRTVDRFALEDRCRALTNAVYLGGSTALCRVLGFYKMYLDTRDTGFASNLLLDGFWEMWLTIFLARQVQAGMTVMDIGANFGYYTLLFGSLVGPEGHVFAVEPNPEIVLKLQRTIHLNGLAARTTLIAAAAGAVDGGHTSLFVPEGEPKNGTITEDPERLAAGLGTVHKVPRVRLGAIAGEGRRIDLIKIDAEGAEEDIITGMEEILRRDRPALLLEFNPRRYRDAGAFLSRLGTLYKRVRYVDFEANAIEGDPATILNDRSGEDWLLFFDTPPADARAAGGTSGVPG
jgi:FkbM family methyltransferase